MKPPGQPVRRKPIAKESKKRKAERAQRKALNERTKVKFGLCLMYHFGGCFGPLTTHEVLKRSAKSGSHLDDQFAVLLCAGHNGWVEDHPLEAQRLGYSMPRWVWDQHGTMALNELARLRGWHLHHQGPRWPFWMPEPI